eukprot:144903-Chlamydomonas_euryale.AAC.6
MLCLEPFRWKVGFGGRPQPQTRRKTATADPLILPVSRRYRSVSSDFVSRIVNPLGEARVTTATVLSAYAAANGSAQLNYDVAVLRLEHPLGQQAGWMGVNARCEPGRVVRYATAGYPYFLGEDSNVCAATTCDVRFENLVGGSWAVRCCACVLAARMPSHPTRSFVSPPQTHHHHHAPQSKTT